MGGLIWKMREYVTVVEHLLLIFCVVDESSGGSVDELLWCVEFDFIKLVLSVALVICSRCSANREVQEVDNGLKEGSQVRDLSGIMDDLNLRRIGCIVGTVFDVVQIRWTCFTVQV